jgi:hypothetical protein
LFSRSADIVHFDDKTTDRPITVAIVPDGEMQMEDLMRKMMMAAMPALAVCMCSIPPAALQEQAAEQSASALLQRDSNLSSAKRKRPQPVPVAPQAFGWRGNDPSLAPDGRPYPVPEYLRGQCYYDDGYGRFSPCNSR